MIDRIAYLIRHRYPSLFLRLQLVAQIVTVMRYSRSVRHATNSCTTYGMVCGKRAMMRALLPSDACLAYYFFDGLSAERFAYFRPHKFDEESLASIFASRAFMNYGLLVEGRMVGYALLKVTPTGSAYIGLMVAPEVSGLGLGKFIVAYLYWQASLAGLRTRSTISRTNVASLRSHQAVSNFSKIADLPSDYIMIEFPFVTTSRPELNIL